jgi:endonuclease/exonuclease/phosphatase family metal-dependent hydrolase
MRQLGIIVIGFYSLLSTGCISVPLEEMEYPHTPDCRVASYNIHFADLNKGRERVTAHAEEVSRLLEDIDADIVFLQEVGTVDFPSYARPCPLRQELAGRLENYGWIGPEGASQTGGSTPILYRFDRYMPIRQGMEWFSDDPTVPDSTGWGNDIPRHMTWALLWDVRAGRHLFVANVHLDHVARRANSRSIREIARLIRRHARINPNDPYGEVPVILSGDLNEHAGWPSRAPLEDLLNPVFGTGHGPTRRGLISLQIDAIYLSEHVSVIDRAILRRQGPSDHHPLVADLHIGDFAQ